MSTEDASESSNRANLATKQNTVALRNKLKTDLFSLFINFLAELEHYKNPTQTILFWIAILSISEMERSIMVSS